MRRRLEELSKAGSVYQYNHPINAMDEHAILTRRGPVSVFTCARARHAELKGVPWGELAV